MELSQKLLKDYARLIVRIGANVQAGQVVQLTVAVDQHAFAALITEECYLAGAKKVNVDWYSDMQSRLNYLYADRETLSRVLPWEEEKARQMTDDLPCRIFIESEDPDAMAGIDPDKISAVTQSRAKVLKPYRNIIDGKHQWMVAAVPSEAWARKVFPGLGTDEAMQRLWDAILDSVRIRGDNDPVADWSRHTAFIEEKAAWLNEQHFESLRYRSANGTDFSVTLCPQARWLGAGSLNVVNGAYYIPNMPTEEIFTSPLAGQCEGTLVATKPLSLNGQLIENFSICFRGGKAVSCKAEKGQAMLEKVIRMDEGSCMLGEVALVPKESPINRSGILFYETLFDENACCHFALGCSYKEVLPDGENLTTEEAKAIGLNDSIIHVDFMVGSEDLAIDGILPDGTNVPIFRGGTWA